MYFVNELALPDLDLHALRIFRLVAGSGSFTRAGEQAGLTQSAITRQIQSLETHLGVRLFERTTRRVRLTAAGEFLESEARRIFREIDRSVEGLQQRFTDAPRKVRVGVARSIGFAYLPGFFSAYRRTHPDDLIEMSYAHGDAILPEILDATIDLGVCCDRKSLPRGLEVTHRFEDRFVGIAPPDSPTDKDFIRDQPFIALAESSESGRQLSRWISERYPKASISMQSDSFDLIINLVSLGFGCAIVPIRALAMYGKRKPITRFQFENPCSRELIVVARRDRSRPSHLQEFIQEILF